ncbi:MAG: sporulation membrane protein YtaF [Candidatus Desulforudis sp.]|nr:sporulation membrane protein YtaF [Desulforudis sp.]
MELLALCVFGFALSLDGFGAGLAYGLRRIKVPVTSMLIISLTSGAAISVSLALGHLAAQGIPPDLAQHLGGWLLILLGVWILLQALRRSTQRILSLRIPQLGVVVQVLLEPLDADMDRSGCISAREAMVLGIALALDAFAAGFAIALSGLFTIFIPLFVVIGLFILLNLGLMMGQRSARLLSAKVNLLPGCLLIMLGLFRTLA